MSDLSNHGENQALDALTDEPWIKLHTGDPGEDGTANAATETGRQQVTLAAASGGSRTTTTDAEWTDIETPGEEVEEEITHVSAWDGEAAGNNEWRAKLAVPKKVSKGDALTIGAGELDFSLD